VTIFYSRGLGDGTEIRYPFNVEMNIDHEYWHLWENDPHANDPHNFSTNTRVGPSRVDIKFSFGNCLDDVNEVKPAPRSAMWLLRIGRRGADGPAVGGPFDGLARRSDATTSTCHKLNRRNTAYRAVRRRCPAPQASYGPTGAGTGLVAPSTPGAAGPDSRSLASGDGALLLVTTAEIISLSLSALATVRVVVQRPSDSTRAGGETTH
jgi:hypothetical protein